MSLASWEVISLTINQGESMTTAEDEALQTELKLFCKLNAECFHLAAKLEVTKDGYLTGRVHCPDCGETVQVASAA